MKITRVSGVVYRQQLEPGGPKPKFAGEGHTAFETMLVKVETDSGIVGWGEAFPHLVWPAVKSLLEKLIAPVRRSLARPWSSDCIVTSRKVRSETGMNRWMAILQFRKGRASASIPIQLF